jgi:hypothetical protein
MSEAKRTRREIVKLAAGGAAAASVLSASAIPAEAYQGNMHRALAELRAARASLESATANKGGHRTRAIALIDQAIEQVRLGALFANSHA